jgi:hypothetical protein
VIIGGGRDGIVRPALSLHGVVIVFAVTDLREMVRDM